MVVAQYIDNVLRSGWHSSISGRPHDVGAIEDEGVDNPRVKVVYESDDDWRRMDLSNYDYITIMDGGIVDMPAKSFGWKNEDVISRLNLDIRTKGWTSENRPGRISLYGERGAGTLAENEAPRWGGLVGEALRVVKAERKGDQEFSIIDASEANDLSSQMGGQVWRATVSVQLETRSSEIDTSP